MTLFAVLVNQRVAESEIGRTEQITLIDEIHIVAMIFIFAIALASIYAEQLMDKGEKDKAVRYDRRGFVIAVVSYIVVNAALVWMAATIG